MSTNLQGANNPDNDNSHNTWLTLQMLGVFLLVSAVSVGSAIAISWSPAPTAGVFVVSTLLNLWTQLQRARSSSIPRQ